MHVDAIEIFFFSIELATYSLVKYSFILNLKNIITETATGAYDLT